MRSQLQLQHVEVLSIPPTHLAVRQEEEGWDLHRAGAAFILWYNCHAQALQQDLVKVGEGWVKQLRRLSKTRQQAVEQPRHSQLHTMDARKKRRGSVQPG